MTTVNKSERSTRSEGERWLIQLLIKSRDAWDLELEDLSSVMILSIILQMEHHDSVTPLQSLF